MRLLGAYCERHLLMTQFWVFTVNQLVKPRSHKTIGTTVVQFNSGKFGMLLAEQHNHGSMLLTLHATGRTHHGASRLVTANIVRGKTAVLLPGLVGMRGLWRHDFGMQNHAHTPPHPHAA